MAKEMPVAAAGSAKGVPVAGTHYLIYVGSPGGGLES